MAKLRMAIPVLPENQVCAGCGKEMQSPLLHTESHDGIPLCLTNAEDGRHNPKPIVYDTEEKKYYFYDETWTEPKHGPFDSFPLAMLGLQAYIKTLEAPMSEGVGEVGMAVGKAQGKIVIDFGSRPVKYVALDALKARDIAQAIFTLAAEIIREESDQMERGLKDLADHDKWPKGRS